jgi:NADH:ubiquinone oxidoreductase subunit H
VSALNAFLTAHSLIVVSIVKTVVLLFLVLTALAYLTWFERKATFNRAGDRIA